MKWKETVIHISSIDIGDIAYKITTNEDTENLSESIRNLGILNLPLLTRKESEYPEYSIISGFRRVKSAKSLGWDKLPARVLEPETGELECAKIAIAENLYQRPLNLIETSKCYKLLSKYLENSDLFSEASSIGLSGNPGLVEKIMRLSDLPPLIQHCVILETLSLPMALELGDLGHETGVAFAKIFNLLRPSLNKQREIVTLSCEIASLEDVKVSDVIDGKGITDIISDNNSDRNVKIRRIREFLRARRFPAIVKAEHNFENKLKKLGLTSGMKLMPPSAFEGNTFTISIEFQNASELEGQLKHFEKMTRNPVFNDILSKTFLSDG
jgi:ParB/RepB/Spo0J family partition protein